MTAPDARQLTQKERSLLEELLSHGTAESKLYAGQLPLMTVASRCGCGCPTINLAVDGKVASHRSPSLILSEASGVSPEGVSFGIILHCREGLISELEVYPLKDGAFTLPEIEQIEFYSQTPNFEISCSVIGSSQRRLALRGWGQPLENW
jgi:hypothetical protein